MSAAFNITNLPCSLLAKIGTLLDDTSVISYACSNTNIATVMSQNKDYIRKARLFETYTANPYKHCTFKCNWLKITNTHHRVIQRASSILPRVQDLYDSSTKETEAISIAGHGHSVFDLSETGYRSITSIKFKGSISDMQLKYKNAWNGHSQLVIKIPNSFMQLLIPDENGYYELLSDYLPFTHCLHFGKLQGLSIEIRINYSDNSSLLITRQNVNREKSSKFIEDNADKIFSVACFQLFQSACVVSIHKNYEIDLFHLSGESIGICLIIKTIDKDTQKEKDICPSLIKRFTVQFVNSSEVFESFSLDPMFADSNLVQNYKHVFQWRAPLKPCFLIPIQNNSFAFDSLKILVELKQDDIWTSTHAFFLFKSHLSIDHLNPSCSSNAS